MLSAVAGIAQKLSQVVMNPAASVTAGSFDPSSVAFKDSDRDLATLSNYLKIHTKHIGLDWAIDWEKQLISGKAEIELKSVHDATVDEIILDTSYLKIDKVETKGDELKWSLAEREAAMGQALKIKLGKHEVAPGKSILISITYSTTAECTALGWLTKEQTKGGKYPYLYSQCQAIHARSLLPCQDTPFIKATYSATVQSKIPVLMSGLRISPPADEKAKLDVEVDYVYNQPVAIPSYLIAIAAGNLVHKSFEDVPGKNWKTGVWTEPEVMDEAFWEFKEDTAGFVAAAEELTSPYEFGVYDILLLPPSFPYGGMENACLTFATPTLLAHDRSLVDVCAHEISHSWFGNGIGCASWGHFWLNEGWTTYLERLLILKTYGAPARDLSYIIGRKALRDSLEQMKDEPRFQRLVVDYKEFEDPDDAFSSIPYDKGSNFLLYLERLVGGLDVFLPYVKSYVATFSGTSITTDQWRAHLFHFFGTVSNGKEIVHKLETEVDWNEWLHGSGPDLCVDVQYDDQLSKPCYELAARWDSARSDDKKLKEFSPKDLADFSASQKIVFLEKVHSLPALPPAVVAHLDDTYSLDKSENAEIKLRLYEIALESGPEYADKAAAWVVDKGRMKMCRTIYRALFKVAPELAKKTFLAHAGFYHPIARKMIAKDLGVSV